MLCSEPCCSPGLRPHLPRRWGWGQALKGTEDKCSEATAITGTHRGDGFKIQVSYATLLIPSSSRKQWSSLCAANGGLIPAAFFSPLPVLIMVEEWYCSSSFANSVPRGNSYEAGFILILKENKFGNVKIFHKTDFQMLPVIWML